MWTRSADVAEYLFASHDLQSSQLTSRCTICQENSLSMQRLLGHAEEALKLMKWATVPSYASLS